MVLAMLVSRSLLKLIAVSGTFSKLMTDSLNLFHILNQIRIYPFSSFLSVAISPFETHLQTITEFSFSLSSHLFLAHSFLWNAIPFSASLSCRFRSQCLSSFSLPSTSRRAPVPLFCLPSERGNFQLGDLMLIPDPCPDLSSALISS